MNAILLALLLPAYGPWGIPPPYSGGSISGGDIVNADDWYGTCMATDAAVSPINVFTPKCIYPGADPANGTGGNIIVSGSPGERTITGTTRAGTAGDTIAFVVQLNTGSSSTVTFTEGVTWVCAAAASDIECICNLKAAVAGHATLGSIVTVNSTDATCSDEKLSFGVVPGTSWQLSVTPSDTTNMVVSNGENGIVLISPNISVGTPSLAAANDPNTGFGWRVADQIEIYTGGTRAAYLGGAANGNYWIGNLIVLGNYDIAALSQTSNDGTKGIYYTNTKGAKSLATLKVSTVTFAGGAGDASKTATGLCPIGAINCRITGYNTVANTGACTSVDIGTAAVPNLYCDDCAVTLSSTFSPATGGTGPGHTALPSWIQLGAAGDVVVTGNGGNCVALAVRLTAHYQIDTADTTL